MNLQNALSSLSEKREFFYSEADFQFALAWEIQLLYRDASIQLEYPWGSDSGKTAYIDILVELGGQSIPIELKYRKDALYLDGRLVLPKQGAKDLGCYDCIKDLCRLERYVKLEKACTVGYALWLTNDLSYTGPPRANAGYSAFSIHEGAEKHGLMQWGGSSGTGTRSKREEPLLLHKKHLVHWQDYHNFGVKNGLFKYALIEV